MNTTPLLLVAAIGMTGPVVAQVCNPASPYSTPANDFIDHGNGTVTHSKTGLMWKKCAEGQTLSPQNASCAGSPAYYDWQSALKHAAAVNVHGYAGYNDWRVPNVKELISLIEEKCHDPAINLKVFSTAPSEWFWSASGLADDSEFAYTVSFKDGDDGRSLKIQSSAVRLVRGGRIR